MAKQIKQFRFYGSASNNNYPSNLNWRQLVSGSAFNDFMPTIQLGIQTVPGTKFYLNGSTNPVIIGNTGIYELDLQGMTEINALAFDASSIQAILSNPNAYLIVDLLYDKGGN